MDSVNNITVAINAIVLEDEEDGALAIDISEGNEQNNHIVFDAKLCLMEKFLTEGQIYVPSMKQTLAARGKGVFIKEIDINLPILSGVDVKRVISGSPWSFNRIALIINHKSYTRWREHKGLSC